MKLLKYNYPHLRVLWKKYAATIHDAESRRQNLGMVNNAYVRVVNMSDGKEIARYDLSEDSSLETAMIFAELYKRNGEWKFKVIGQGTLVAWEAWLLVMVFNSNQIPYCYSIFR